MCGLFGAVSSSLVGREKDHVKFLAVLSSIRGVDSTGIAVIRRGKKGHHHAVVHKALGNSVSFLSDRETNNAFGLDNTFAILGHTRWATLGAINVHNAQPIEEGPIVLCHNGSIPHFLKDKNDEKDSDSRELARRLDREPLPDVVRAVGNGHFAITYADFDTRTINFIRNWYRPLAFMYDIGGGTLYWASEIWMLQSLRYKVGTGAFKEPVLMEIDNLYEIPFGSVKGKNVNLSPPKTEVKAGNIIPRERAILAFCKKCNRLACICDEITTAKPTLLYKGYNGSTLTIGAVMPRLKRGCANCAKPSTPRDKVKWFAENEFVCEACAEGDTLTQECLLKGNRVYDSELVRLQ